MNDALRFKRRRGVCEDMRVEEEWADPGGRQRRDTGKCTNEIRRADEWELRGMIIVAGRNQCDCATVIGLIRIWMNTLVQFRGSTQQQRPQKRCKHECCDTSPTRIRATGPAVHHAAIFRQRKALRKQFCLGSF
jgi:hypothetical protein